MWRPSNDGKTHVNVYSKGQTELGRLLSNFAPTPFKIPFWGYFASVEAFWYWWMTRNEALRDLHGYEAKKLGKTSTQVRPHPSARILRIAYKAKLRHNPKIERLLRKNKLPLTHYYVYDGAYIPATEWEWTAKLWEEL